jgi:hypothetical protein
VRFEVRYPSNGSRQELEVRAELVVLGRDPSCDIVLNDVKCSRRHAVVERGAQGLSIRDTGSSNGIYLNGRRVERAPLAPGDVVRLGEVVVKVLPENLERTLAMTSEDLHALDAAPSVPVATAAPAAPAAPVPGIDTRTTESAEAPPEGPLPRPATLLVLAALWALAAPAFAGLGLWWGLAGALARGWAVATVVGGLSLAALAVLMAFGTLARQPWTRGLQIGLAALGLLLCPFTLACVATLVYLTRPEARVHFSGRRHWHELNEAEQRLLRREGAEAAFAGTLLGTVALGVLLTALAFYYARPRFVTPPPPASDITVLSDLRRLLEAQRHFKEGTASTCGLGYADLDGLLHPANVIPNYRADGPAFLPPSFAEARRYGYTFTLALGPALPLAPGCPRRAFRSFVYSASPALAGATHYSATSDGRIRAAVGRPPTPEDAIVEVRTVDALR